MIRIFLALALLFTVNVEAKKYRYTVAACAIFQNESNYLKEWIEYHRLIGVEQFYLYNHLSTDNYKAVLQPYIKKGIVKLVEWNHPANDLQTWNQVQCDAYAHCIKETKEKVDWLAIIDIDEFIVLTHENTLQPFLAKFFDVGSIAVHWQMFGTSGVKQIPKNKLLIETLTMRAISDHPENTSTKSILRPRRVKFIDNPHSAEFLDPWFQVNSRYERVGGPANAVMDIENIRINHYWSRDERFFETRKCVKRMIWGESLDVQLDRLNALSEVEDTTILRFVPQLRQKMGL